MQNNKRDRWERSFKDVTLRDLAYNLDQVFATDIIKSFHVRDLPNHPNSGKRRVALDFKSGFDGAMEAQNLLDGYKYTLDNGNEYTLKAKVNHDPVLQRISDSFEENLNYQAALVQYHDMSHGRILDMHLDSLKKQREIIKTERKLLKEKKKLRKEKQRRYGEYVDTEDSSDYVKKTSKKRKHKSDKKKKDKKKKKRDRSSSSSSSSSEGLDFQSDYGRSRSSTPVKKKDKSPSIEDFRPYSNITERRKSTGTALVPYTTTRDTRTEKRSWSRSPRRHRSSESSLSSSSTKRSRRRPSLSSSSTKRSGRRPSFSSSSTKRSERRPSLSSSSTKRSGRRPSLDSIFEKRRPSLETRSLRRSRSPDSPARRRPSPVRRSRRSPSPDWSSAKRSRPSSTRYKEAAYRSYRSPPSPSTSYRRYSDNRFDKESVYIHRRETAPASTSHGDYSVSEVDNSYELGSKGRNDEDELVKDIEDLLESVGNDDEGATEQPTSKSPNAINITLKMNVVKSNPPHEHSKKKESKKNKIMPVPIKIEPEDTFKAKKDKIAVNMKDLMPKPIPVDQKYVNVKKERDADEVLEDGEIYEIDDDEEESLVSIDMPTDEYIPAPFIARWEPVNPPPDKPPVKTVPKNPRFVLPIKKLVLPMKRHFKDVEKIKQFRLNAVLKDLLAARIKVLLTNEGYKCTRDIVAMYREKYPSEEDEQLIKQTLKEIDEGIYDVWIDDDGVVEVKQEKEANAKGNKNPGTHRNQMENSGNWVLPFMPKPKVDQDDDIFILEEDKPTLDLTLNDGLNASQDVKCVESSTCISKPVRVKIDVKVEPPVEISFLRDSIFSATEKKSDSSDKTVVLELQSDIFNAEVKQEIPGGSKINDELDDAILNGCGAEAITVKERHIEHLTAARELERNDQNRTDTPAEISPGSDKLSKKTTRPRKQVGQPVTKATLVDPAARKASLINEILKITDKSIQKEIVAPAKTTEASNESQPEKLCNNINVRENVSESQIKTEFVETVDDIAKFVQEVEVDKKVIDLTEDKKYF